MKGCWYLTAIASLAMARTGWAQEPVRVGLMSEPRVGQEAPDFSHPYLTSEGPGPADQPFHLRSELGRRVLLLAGGDPTGGSAVEFWRSFAARRDRLVPPGVVVVALVRAGMERAQALAGQLGPGVKILADSTARILRSYGASGRSQEVRIFVVSDIGWVSYRARAGGLDDTEAARLGSALREGR